MSSVIERERQKYEDMWSVEEYSAESPGARVLPLFLRMTDAVPGSSVLDAGCGSGKGSLALIQAGFRVTLCDLTDEGLVNSGALSALPDEDQPPFYAACLWNELRPYVGFHEWVYCCDVLEHMPTALTMLAVSRLLECAGRGVFLSIGTRPDDFGLWVGQALHQTVQPFAWWRDQLSAMCQIVDSRDLINSAVFVVKTRC